MILLRNRIPATKSRQRGVALVAVSLMVVVLAGLSLSLFIASSSWSKEQRARGARLQTLYAAEAGIAEVMAALESGQIWDEDSLIGLGMEGVTLDVQDLGGGATSVVATATGSDGKTRLQVFLAPVATEGALEGPVLIGLEGLRVRCNALVDSYRSSLGRYARQAEAGQHGHRFAREGAQLYSNGRIVLEANARIHGVVVSTQEQALDPILAPEVEVPEIDRGGHLVVPHHDIVHLRSGHHRFGALEIGRGSTLMVRGPATIVVDSLVLLQRGALRIDDAEGPVSIYSRGELRLEEGACLTPNSKLPQSVSVTVAACDDEGPPSVTMDPNSAFIGVLEAPLADVHIGSTAQFFGALVARRVDLRARSEVHLDEDLQRPGTTALKVMAWHVLPPGAAVSGAAYLSPVPVPEADSEGERPRPMDERPHWAEDRPEHRDPAPHRR